MKRIVLLYRKLNKGFFRYNHRGFGGLWAIPQGVTVEKMREGEHFRNARGAIAPMDKIARERKRTPILLFLIFLLVNINLGRAEMNKGKSMVLLAVGEVDSKVLKDLKSNLENIFHKSVTIGSSMPEPEYAFNSKRKQYFADAILDRVAQEREYQPFERVLAVVDRDLYVPELNFVFGIASSKIALISITRLRQQYYFLLPNDAIFKKRVLTEAVHELGHTYGLGHCSNPHCVMFFSNTLLDTDRKGYEFCASCNKDLKKRLGY